VDRLFQKLQQFFGERAIEAYLVGGSLRDVLLGQRLQDLDLAVRGDTEPVARALADELKGRCIPLNLEKGVKRVILRKKPYSRFIIDIAPLHGEDIADDLARRDFTINALALPTAALSALSAMSRAQPAERPASLLDPCNGWRDLQTCTVRVVQEDVFQKDPLRLLRAIRLSASRQLSIEPATAAILRRDAPLLIRVAPARIRDELLQMTALPHVTRAISALDAYQLLPSIFPDLYATSEPAPLHPLKHEKSAWPTLHAAAKLLSASQGEIASLSQAEQQMLAPLLRLSQRPAFKKHWKKSPGGACTRSALLLLAALLTDLLQEKPAAVPLQPNTTEPLRSAAQLRTIAAALRQLTLGRQAAAFIIFLLEESVSPWTIEPRPQAKDGAPWIAARHYFEQFGERGVDLAAFRLARQVAALQGATPDEAGQLQTLIQLGLLEAYYNERNMLIPPPLLDGETIITRLGLAKGPLIGALLKKVRSAQLDGIIQSRAEALQFIAEQFAASERQTALRSKPSSQSNNAQQKPPGE
jgi:poly(A) polymerase